MSVIGGVERSAGNRGELEKKEKKDTC